MPVQEDICACIYRYFECHQRIGDNDIELLPLVADPSL